MRLALLALLITLSCLSQAQDVRFTGNVRDTTGSQPLPNAILMGLKFKDSTLVKYSRSDRNGVFKPFTMPRDTYIVIISHPSFSDKTYVLVLGEKDTAINFKNVQLPPKSVSLKEIEVLAYKEKSYYKGDTLVFTADSFHTQANATVEDLLKRLPGFRVDAEGKITVQGKQVDQVLVDGDEFFGSDPTVATRNLAATTVENVQVYEKKNESTEEGQNETLKVVNLQLKDDAKKGYFGKASGATDFNKYYENEVLANKFKGNQKLSLFGLMANTPKQAFNWNDVDRYGLTGEERWSYDDETGNWSQNGNQGTGIPRTNKAGAYFNDKFGKSTKLNADYTFNNNRLISNNQTNTQFFLSNPKYVTGDTTYTNKTKDSSALTMTSHALNMKLVTKLDSLTEFTFQPKVRYNSSSNDRQKTDAFISKTNELTRSTLMENDASNETMDLNANFRIKRNFMKKDRALIVQYQPVYNSNNAKTILTNKFRYFTSDLPDSIVNQRRSQDNTRMENNASIQFIEPWTKKFKTEFSYNFNHNKSSSRRETYDVGSTGNDIFNPVLSNNFDNYRIINRGGAKFIYDVKKYRMSLGAQYRNVMQRNVNVTTSRDTAMSVNNILPNAGFTYRFNQGSQLQLNYTSNSQQPDLQQMQPVIDNSDPNRISRGNPGLRPTWNNNVNANYWFYKGISDVNFWSGGNFNSTDHQISNTTFYDEMGRAITTPTNVNGNYHVGVWVGGGFPMFKRFMKTYLSMNANHDNNVTIVNRQRTVSQNYNLNPNITFEKDVEKYEVSLSADYEYNLPYTSISNLSQQPYYTYGFQGRVQVKLPKKFTVETDGNYTNNGNRTPGYNINYFILNASVTKSFLKTEALQLSVMGNDILNQNISNQRYINSNQIVDKKTQVIRRYFLIRLLYKFNSQQAPPDDED